MENITAINSNNQDNAHDRLEIKLGQLGAILNVLDAADEYLPEPENTRPYMVGIALDLHNQINKEVGDLFSVGN